MRKLSRREIREFLLQALYARSMDGTAFDLRLFTASYYDRPMDGVLSDPYFIEAYEGIIAKEGEILAITTKFAPKFDTSIMPLVNLLPIFIAVYEMLYLQVDQVPENVSINEAVELAKRFSDDGARELVNGVLASVKAQKEEAKSIVPVAPHFFI